MGFNETYMINKDLMVTNKGIIDENTVSIAPILEFNRIWVSKLLSPANLVNTKNNNIYFGDNSGNIKSLSSEDGTLLWNYPVHTGIVVKVIIASTGNIISAGFSDKTVRVTDVATGLNLWKFTGHTDGVNSILQDPVSKDIYSCSCDGTVKRINGTGVQVWSYQANSGFIFEIAWATNNCIFAGTANGEVIKLDSSGNLIWRKSTGSSAIRTLYLAPLFMYACTSGGKLIKMDTNGNIINIYVLMGINGSILDMDIDPLGAITVVTNTGYLSKITVDGATLLTQRISPSGVHGIRSDALGYLYASCDTVGIVKINKYLQIVGYREV